MQGVSVNLFIKTGKKEKGENAKVFYNDLYGERQKKYDILSLSSFYRQEVTVLTPIKPYYFFTPKDFSAEAQYNEGFKIDELFIAQSSGITFRKDKVFVHFSKEELDEMLALMDSSVDNSTIANRYSIKENEIWNLECKRRFFRGASEITKRMVEYRPFDSRYCYYPDKETLQQVILRGDHRYDKMQNLIKNDNYAIVVSRQCTSDWRYAFVTKSLNDMNLLSSAGMFGRGYVFPLYVYSDNGERIPNVSEKVFNIMREQVDDLALEDLVDYIYAVLYSPSYRETYKEFLKIDFPRVPYPKNAEQFHRLAEKGAELRKLHLMENASSWPMTVSFPVAGDNIIDKLAFADGKVFINATQYFGGVSDLAWNFFIGGYQPAQKWLKDRKGRALDYQDILHYGHIIYALEQTGCIMKEIDEIGVISLE